MSLLAAFNVPQDQFNKLYTAILTIFFMAVYVYSYISGKPFDWMGLLAFTVPTVNHVVHQITASQATLRNIDADVTKSVAATKGANGASTSTN